MSAGLNVLCYFDVMHLNTVAARLVIYVVRHDLYAWFHEMQTDRKCKKSLQLSPVFMHEVPYWILRLGLMKPSFTRQFR